MKNDTTPGEWQTEVNPWGGVRRFRMVGPIKEYEALVIIDGASIPESEVEAYNARKREQERQTAEAMKANPQPPRKTCPFSQALDPVCHREKCAMFDGERCTLAPAGSAARNTAGLRCPFTSTVCRADCAFYLDGCTMTAAERK